jgi:hypothetical protein
MNETNNKTARRKNDRQPADINGAIEVTPYIPEIIIIFKQNG